MPLTIKKIIEQSLVEIGALTEGTQPTADMIESGKLMFQQLIAQWSVKGFMIPYATRTVLIGDNTKASYSWGPGGDINSVAPVDVAAVSFVLGNGQVPLEPVNNSVYMGWRWLGNVGQPSWFYYERALPRNILHFDVAPAGGAFRIIGNNPLTTAFELTDLTEFPDFYGRMIRTNLAIELAPQYELPVSADLRVIARESKQTVQGYNAKPVPDMRLDDMPASNRTYAMFPLRAS